MIKTQPIKKYIAPAIVATSIAVFSPVLIDDVSAHGGPDIEETNTGAQTSNSEGSTSNDSKSNDVEATEGGITILSGNSDVGDVQQKLRDKGYNLTADGLDGPETESNLKSFQADQGIQVDGIVGDDTSEALGGDSSSNNNEEVAPASETEETSNNESNETAETTTEEAGEGDPQAPAPVTASLSNDDAPVASGSAVDKAQSLIGTPYAWGGTDPDVGLDSSGFINAVFSDKDLSRTHAGMWANNGTQVNGNPQPGDVVFFEGTYKDGVSHSGVYIGNHQMVHSGGEGQSVSVTDQDSWDYYWADKYIGAKRF